MPIRNLLLAAFLAIFCKFLAPSEALARPFPKMQETLGASCPENPLISFDLYRMPREEKSPVIVRFMNEPPAKPIRKGKIPAKTPEMFAVAQGFAHINVRLSRTSRKTETWNADRAREGIQCIMKQIPRMGGHSEKVFLLASKESANALLENLVPSTGRKSASLDSKPVAGYILVAPSTPRLTSSAGLSTDNKTAPHNVLLVDTAKEESVLAATDVARWLLANGTTLGLSPERKSRDALLTEYGMASDIVTKHIVAFIHKRIREVEKTVAQKSPKLL